MLSTEENTSMGVIHLSYLLSAEDNTSMGVIHLRYLLSTDDSTVACMGVIH